MALREYVYVAEQQEVGMKIPLAQKNEALEAQVVLQRNKQTKKPTGLGEEVQLSGAHSAGKGPCQLGLLFSYLKNSN